MSRITEKIRINIDRCEPSSPFYVRWYDEEIGYGFWLFDTAQSWGGNVSRSQEYQPYFASLSISTTNRRNLITEHEPTVTCYAENLTTPEILGMETLLRSPRVEWLYDLANNKWKEVIPDVGSYELYSTDGVLHDITIKFKLPKTNIQSN